MGHIGVKWSQNLQGIKTNWFGALLSSQNRKICKKLKKRWKNAHFLAVFRSFFRFGWKVAHKTIMLSIVGVSCFFWVPLHPYSITTSGTMTVYSLFFQICQQCQNLWLGMNVRNEEVMNIFFLATYWDVSVGCFAHFFVCQNSICFHWN